MLSRFFVDRPIFATVLSVIILLVGGISLAYLPITQYPRITPPGVNVSIRYPGANAQVVAETVAAPIEQQVNGIPGMLYMSSQSGNDGSYSLACTFDVGVDIDAALVMVQNRVTLALPLLPTPVQRQGITIRKKTADILQIISLYSSDGRYDDLYLSNYALLNLRDELLRVDGVSDVNIFGQRDYSIRVWLDPQKLASRNMTALDVAEAVRLQNVETALGQIGQAPMHGRQAFQLPIDTLARLSDPAQFRDIVVKVSRDPPNSPTAASSGRGALAGLPGTGLTDPLRWSPTPSRGNLRGGGNAASSRSRNQNADSENPPTNAGVTTAGGSTPYSTDSANSGGIARRTDEESLAIELDLPRVSLTAGGASGGENGAISSQAFGPKTPSSSIVRLGDVARIEMGALNYSQASYFNGKPTVGLAVSQLPGTNALEVAERVRAKIQELRTRFPEGLEYAVGYDTTPFIRESIDEVFKTLRDAVILVAIVVLLFLQDWRAMILPMIDVPVSLIGTFAVMALVGYSLNNISLFGLVLAIGIVVDDAIVVLENIERQMARGLDPRSATLKAMEEITGPIIAITLVLCAVFIPCAFISGITGRFFQQFAVTIAASTVISAINALTMTPSRALLIFRNDQRKGDQAHEKQPLPWWTFAVAGGLLTWIYLPDLFTHHFGLSFSAQETAESTPGWLVWAFSFTWIVPGLLLGALVGYFLIQPMNALLRLLFSYFNRFFDSLTGGYGFVLRGLMIGRGAVLMVYGGLLILTYWISQIAPTGFVPQQDMGRCLASIQLPDASSLERTKAEILQIEKLAREIPGVEHTFAICGFSFVQQSNGPNFGSLFIILKPFEERQTPDLKDEAIMAKLRRVWAKHVRDANVMVFGAAPIPGLSVSGGFKVIVEDRGGIGVKSLQEQTDRLVQRLRQEPGLAGVSTNFRSSIPQLFLEIDWTKAASLGVSPDAINQTLQIYQGSLYVNSFNEFGRRWQVTLQADSAFRSDAADLRLLEVRNKSGQMVSLGTLTQVKVDSGPIFINRYNLYTAAAITGSLKPGASSGPVIQGVEKVADEVLPRYMKTDWTELMFLQRLEGNSMPASAIFALSVLFVFLALAALYESWALPLAVILVVPLCVLCSVVGILATNGSVNIFVQIGLVVLIGLACKNAILVVEFARELHTAGRPLFEATVEAASHRLRPILMTSLAFILGVVPLVFASGAGSEMRRSLGTAVFSGMLGVTIFGVFLTPVFFAVIQGYGERHSPGSTSARFIASAGFGLLLGLTVGFLVARLGQLSYAWAIPIGGCLGLLAVIGAYGIHRRRTLTKPTRSRGNPTGQAPNSSPSKNL